ncbi:MAG: transcriptional regulator [Ferroplasma sp.]|uniref:transcriptional regulator n=1 Tax=Ferroplasma sp. TaxID=2591003 RepID=UPI0028164EFA|nr:transcriptional regulator [Ferroplasma sp.]WMT52126.1 MAG: transcriptional regulator [Ferroplasma sp.]
MKIEQALISQLMILLNIKNGKTRPSEISKELDITLQGVVYHIKILREKGFIDEKNGITKEGFDFLYNGLNYIEDFVHSSLISIDSSLVWEVISDDNIASGQKVSLYMKHGYLHAGPYKGKGAHGIAVKNSMKGECTGVTAVREIIKIDKSRIVIATFNNVEKVQDMKTLAATVQDYINNIKFDFIGITGEMAKTIADMLGINPDFEYASVNAAFEAAKRGFTTLILVSDRFFHFSLNEIRELQAKNPGVELDLRHI